MDSGLASLLLVLEIGPVDLVVAKLVVEFVLELIVNDGPNDSN